MRLSLLANGYNSAILYGVKANIKIKGLKSLTAKLRASSGLAERKLNATFRSLIETLRDAGE